MEEEEREMCPTCKRDVPVANYRTHTAHCRRSAVACGDCGESVAKGDMDRHMEQAHQLKICDQCGVSVEAIKMHDHRTLLCPKLLLVCKYCEQDVPASEMSEHENECGDSLRECQRCGYDQWVPLRDWEKHMNTWHGLMVQRSPGRQRKQSSTQALPTVKADTSTMLPCEFCEGLVPIEKLLEHQAQCVNPTNVRGGSALRNSASISSFNMITEAAAANASFGSQYGVGLSRSHSLHGARHTKTDDSLRPHSSYSHYRSLSRTASVREGRSSREGRATTEDRSMRASSLLRQSSFTEKPRRSESLSRCNSFSRSAVRYSSVYAAHFTSDLNSAFKRSDSVFDGLNDVGTTCGRLSRRNSITDSLYSVGTRRSGSSAASVATNSANNSGDYPHVPAMLASYQANRLAATSSQTPSPATQHKEATRNKVKKDVSRQNSSEETAAKSSGALSVSGSEGRVSDKERSSPTVPAHKVVKIKLRRKVSFTEREPVIINDNIEVRQQQPQREDEEQPLSEVSATQDPRMRRKRDKDRTKRRSSRRDRSQDAIKEERRKSQPLGEELFEQLNNKLKVIEKEQQKKNDEDKAKKEAAKALEEEKRAEEQIGIRHNVADSGYQSRQQHRPDSGGAFGESSCSSKAITSSECSPLQKPKNNNNNNNRSSGGIFTAASIFGTTPSSSEASSQLCQQQTSLPSAAEMVRLREKTSSGSRNDSKSSSKRSSLDGKTVAGLAQDLAAECARAFALMESSLSKLSMDFSGKSQAGCGGGGGEGGSGPFSLGARTKKSSRRSRPNSQVQ